MPNEYQSNLQRPNTMLLKKNVHNYYLTGGKRMTHIVSNTGDTCTTTLAVNCAPLSDWISSGTIPIRRNRDFKMSATSSAVPAPCTQYAKANLECIVTLVYI